MPKGEAGFPPPDLSKSETEKGFVEGSVWSDSNIASLVLSSPDKSGRVEVMSVSDALHNLQMENVTLGSIDEITPEQVALLRRKYETSPVQTKYLVPLVETASSESVPAAAPATGNPLSQLGEMLAANNAMPTETPDAPPAPEAAAEPAAVAEEVASAPEATHAAENDTVSDETRPLSSLKEEAPAVANLNSKAEVRSALENSVSEVQDITDQRTGSGAFIIPGLKGANPFIKPDAEAGPFKSKTRKIAPDARKVSKTKAGAIAANIPGLEGANPFKKPGSAEAAPESAPAGASNAERNAKNVSGSLDQRAGVFAERAEFKHELEGHRAALKTFINLENDFKKKKKPTEAEVRAFEVEKSVYAQAKAELIKKQLGYTAALQESVSKKLENRPTAQRNPLDDLKNYRGKGHFTAEEVEKRYNRMVRLREIVIPAVEQENQVREELLNEKGRGLWGTIKHWNKKATEWTEGKADSIIRNTKWAEGKSDEVIDRRARAAARAARLLGFATAGTVVGMIAGGSAALVAGAASMRVLYGLSGIVVGSGAGYVAGEQFAHGKGEKLASKFDAMQEQAITSEADLMAQAEAQKTGSADALRDARRNRENFVAAITGGATGFLAGGGFEAMKHVGESLWGFLHGDAHEVAAAASGSSTSSAPVKVPGAKIPGSTTTTTTLGAPNGPIAPPAPSIPNESMTIGDMDSGVKLNDADKLFGHFRLHLHEQLDAQFPGGKGLPPALKAFLNQPAGENPLANEDALTKLLGFQDGKGLSAMMHTGDKLTFENGSLIFKPLHGDAHTLIDPSGKVTPIDMSKMHTTGGAHAAAAASPDAAPAEVPKVAGDAPAPAATPEKPLVDGTQGPAAAPADVPVKPVAAPGAALDAAPQTGPRVPADDGISGLSDDGGASSVTTGTIPSSGIPNPGSGDGISGLELPTASSFEVNPDVTAGYTWRIPGTTVPQPYAFGGTEKASEALARASVARHPGSVMYYTHKVSHLFGRPTYEVRGWSSDARGVVSKIPKALVDAAGRRVAPPNPLEFVAPLTN